MSIGLQLNNRCLHPYTDEDWERLENLKENQVVLVKVLSKGFKKQRSYQQLKLFHAAISVVVANTDHPNWNTKAKAKLSLKVALNFVDESAMVYNERTGQVVVKYRSFGYDDLEHMEACRVFDRAWPILAKVIGVTGEELLDAAHRGDYPRGLP